jgi:hypothetical protein
LSPDFSEKWGAGSRRGALLKEFASKSWLDMVFSESSVCRGEFKMSVVAAGGLW